MLSTSAVEKRIGGSVSSHCQEQGVLPPLGLVGPVGLVGLVGLAPVG